jgi:hypothetical protein
METTIAYHEAGHAVMALELGIPIRSADIAFDGDHALSETLYLQWFGDPYPIVSTLQVVGFGERVEHDGSPENAIAIHPKGTTASSGSKFQAAG